MDATNPLLIAMKERRFTSTARVLGEEKAIGVKVKIVQQAQHAAWWDSSARTITLNDSMPKATDAKQTLIWERAKLFHELFHVMFTTNKTLREKLMRASKDRNRYLWVSNVLEDGRIEYHGGKLYQGTTWYIRTLLSELVKSDSPDSALLIYVRTKVWRNKAEAKYWRKFVALIDEAITAPTSNTAWENATKIVDAMYKPKPKPPCTCPDCGAPMPDLSHARINMAMSVCPTCGATSSDDGDGDGGGDGGAPSPTDDGDDDGDDDDGSDGGSQSPDDGDSDADGDGGGQGGGDENEDATDDPSELPDPSAPTDDDAQKEIDDMIEEAKDQIDSEVEEELIELDSEVSGYEEEQEYVGDEEQIATELTEVFASLLVESERQKYNPCKVGGRLNTRRLIETQTGGDYMQEQEDKLHQPHIVLLIDESCSMRGRAAQVSTAARILNGAIQASGAESVAISFGGTWESFVPMKIVPKRGFDCNGGSTPTGEALKAAGTWLDQENASRGMVVVITDGQPSWRANAVIEFQTLAAKGYFVLNVLLGGYNGDNSMLEMCHAWVEVKDINTLVRVLEEPLGNFLSGDVLVFDGLHLAPTRCRVMHTKNKTMTVGGDQKLPQILEEVDGTVHIFAADTNPDDIAFNRAKPVLVLPAGTTLDTAIRIRSLIATKPWTMLVFTVCGDNIQSECESLQEGIVDALEIFPDASIDHQGNDIVFRNDAGMVCTLMQKEVQW